MGVYEDYLAAASGVSPQASVKPNPEYGPIPPTLGSGLSAMTQINPGANFMTGSAPGAAPLPRPGFGTDGVITADSAKAAAGNGMERPGGIAGSYDGKGVNDILARENKARGEMIDLSIAANGGNGINILGDGGIEAANAEKTARWRQDDLLSKVKNSPALASVAQGVVAGNNQLAAEGMRSTAHYATEIARQGITARGQDLNAMSDANRNAVTMRGQDINAMSDAARLGLEGKRIDVAKTAEDRAAERWNVERPGLVASAKDSETVRNARQGLMAAIESGDPKAIEKAKSAAVAAGIKFDKPNNEYVTTTDSMGTNITRTNKDTGAVDVIEGKSGKVKASIPAPGAQQTAQAPVPQGFTAIGTSGGKRVLQDAQGNRFVEGN